MPRLGGLARHVVASASPSRARELEALDRQMRARLPLSTRVGLVGVSGGVGCSVVGGLVVSTFAARRGGPVLAVNASAGGRSLLWHAGSVPTVTSSAKEVTARSRSTSLDEAVTGLARTPGGAYCLDLARDGGTVDEHQWWEGVGSAGRFFDVVVSDFGARTADRCAAVAAASSVVCVVTDVERSAWQHGVDLAASFIAVDVPAVLVVNAVRGPAPAWCRTAARLSPVPTVLLPHDPAHGSPSPAPGWALRASTSLAALRVCARVVRTQDRDHQAAAPAVGHVGAAS